MGQELLAVKGVQVILYQLVLYQVVVEILLHVMDIVLMEHIQVLVVAMEDMLFTLMVLEQVDILVLEEDHLTLVLLDVLVLVAGGDQEAKIRLVEAVEVE